MICAWLNRRRLERERRGRELIALAELVRIDRKLRGLCTCPDGPSHEYVNRSDDGALGALCCGEYGGVVQ